MAERHNVFARLFRGETSFDFAGRWRRWFMISGAVILIGLVSVGVRGINFSVDFKGGTIWEVPTSASVSATTAAIDKAVPGIGSTAQVTILTHRHPTQRNIQVQAGTKATTNGGDVLAIRQALATLADTNVNNVNVEGVGASWGSNITDKAVKAVIIFLIAVTIYIWLRFEGKMAVAALVALLHDILVTIGIYSLSGFQVSPDTVIAFLTILGYSLYDTIVVFDKVQENTRSVASSAKYTYSDYVNLSMNQVLARSLNTSFVAIIPILSIEVIGAGILGASTLNDFGLALLIGLTTGAYSSIFIASPLLGVLKEREPRYADIRRRLASTPARRVTPAAAAAARAVADTGGGAGPVRPAKRAVRPTRRPAPVRPVGTTATLPDETTTTRADGSAEPLTVPERRAPPGPVNVNGDADGNGAPAQGNGGPGEGNGDRSATPVPPRSTANRPPPRPRKKKRR